MSDIKRRQMLQLLGATPAVALTWTTGAEAAEEQAAKPAAPAAAKTAKAAAKPGTKGARPQFFDAHEFATVTLLADLIIPKDERSGSASDAGVPEFIDYTLGTTLADAPDRGVAIRGGLKWLDKECLDRFEKPFLACTETQRTQVLDDIAWPKKAKPEFSHGVKFFSQFRDYVASGFFSSKVGIEDLQYKGNVPNMWDGAPPEVLAKLGVSY
jgi:hypothetical protein